MPNPKHHKLVVDFQTCRCNKDSAAVGVRVSRPQLRIEEAAELFVNAQLECTICYDPLSNGDTEQGSMIETEVALELVAETRGLSIKQDHYTVSLSLPKTAVGDEFYGFAGRPGVLTARKLGPAPERKRGRPPRDDADDEDEFDNEEDR